MQRSELVTVPERSPQPAAGNNRYQTVRYRFSVSFQTPPEIHTSPVLRAPELNQADTAGFVAITHNARILPSPTALNISTAFKPGLRATLGAFQKRATRSQFSSLNVMCDANCAANPPLHGPHRIWLSGHRKREAPGLPIRPVSRCGLIDYCLYRCPDSID